MARTNDKGTKRGKIPEAPSKRPDLNRKAADQHDIKVTTEAEEARFAAWCDSFGMGIADVLYDADLEVWECDPARDTYLRFGWDKRFTAADILAWWKYKLEYYEEEKWKPQIGSYKAACKALKAVL